MGDMTSYEEYLALTRVQQERDRAAFTGEQPLNRWDLEERAEFAPRDVVPVMYSIPPSPAVLSSWLALRSDGVYGLHPSTKYRETPSHVEECP